MQDITLFIAELQENSNVSTSLVSAGRRGMGNHIFYKITSKLE